MLFGVLFVVVLWSGDSYAQEVPVGGKPGDVKEGVGRALPDGSGEVPGPGAPGEKAGKPCKRLADCAKGETCEGAKGECVPAAIDCEQWGGYCVFWKDGCAEGYQGLDPMHCPQGRSAMCCLPAVCQTPGECGPKRWCYEGKCGPLGDCKSADDCIPQSLEKLVCPGAWRCIEGQCEFRCSD